MAITSSTFLFFVLVVLAVYYLLPRRAQNVWLLLVSYFFHITWAWGYALILGVNTLVNYTLGRRISASQDRRRGWLWVGIVFNLSILIVFRMQNFFIPEIEGFLAMLGFQPVEGSLLLLAPVGLSYYVLQNISYLLDVRRGQIPASDDLVDFALYLAYFPKLVAGPIERARVFLPILARERSVDGQAMATGLGLVLTGAARKLLIADTLSGAMPWDLFIAPAQFSVLELWGWLFIYAFALYNDFAGYTSIVRGVSRLFGIELSSNFETPYFSRSLSEFWNRWHITLSHWLRDYIYFPTSRWLASRIPNRNHPLHLLIPPLITLLVSGLWHGFHLNMVLWGLLHGFYLAGERFWLNWKKGRISEIVSKRMGWAAMLLVFCLVCLAWVSFAMPPESASAYWRGLFTITNWNIYYRRIFLVLPILFVAVVLDWLQWLSKDELVYRGWPRPVRAALTAGVLLLIMIATYTEQVEPFIYQGF